MLIVNVLPATFYNLTNKGEPGHFVCKYSGGDRNYMCVAEIALRICSYSTFLNHIMYRAVVYLSIDNTLAQWSEI